ncbi:methyltransferase, TIGR04325 family [Pedobacter aquatilis]|uniref:methyltransferase, TIGR04325 family n=1 Tax=Pedobacter aquatilis TaxID=351343 RepID=UPI0029309560|nr:methyltransferase, TIGR04325 family [Pedobacter aquatilis]
MIKALVKQILPPIVTDAIIKRRYVKSPVLYNGNYNSWEDAKQNSGGYDAANILEKVKQSILRVKNGEVAYERDSMTQDNVEYSWPLLGALQHIAIENGNTLNVLDFGGSLGTSYFQNRSPLSHLDKLKWTVVEQKHFVECGKEFIEDNVLTFEPTISIAVEKQNYNVLLLSGVHQYMPDTDEFNTEVLSHDFDYILIDRVSFIEDAKRLVVQTVPEWLYKATYPTYLLNEQEFIAPYLKKYDLVYDFNAVVDQDEISEDGKRMYWKGFFLKKK